MTGKLLAVWAAFMGVGGALASDLQIQFTATFGDEAIAFDALDETTASNQKISVTRLDAILSEIALKKEDGSWLGLRDWQAYLSLREGRDTVLLNGVPPAQYTALRFNVGLRPEVNHADASKYAAQHPLNPAINPLYWGWQGEFVFLALEGNWRQADGILGGYSFHLATDKHLLTVELPCAINLTRACSLRASLDIAKIFSGKHRLKLEPGQTSTHSKEGDALAGQLHANLQDVWSIAQQSQPAPSQPAAQISKPPPLIGPDATPYRLTISAFFPRPDLPLDNPLTNEGVELGRRLFHDARLSINNTQSCATCHVAERGFAEPRRLSIGAEGQPGSRNAMPLFNLAWKQSFFWDGRAKSLREQVLLPIQNPIEMHETLDRVSAKLSDLTPAFARAFGSPEITADRLARAIEQFLLTQVSQDSKFDRTLTGQATLTEHERRGFQLFHTEYDPRHGQYGADCFHCHGGPFFRNTAFANNGLDAHFAKDSGLAAVTHKPGDEGKFAVPSLRNIAITGPYMHDGRFETLEQVIDHYDHNLTASDTLDPNLAKHPPQGLSLSREDKSALVAFLRTLTDQRYLSSLEK